MRLKNKFTIIVLILIVSLFTLNQFNFSNQTIVKAQEEPPFPSFKMPWNSSMTGTYNSGPHPESDTNFGLCTPYNDRAMSGLDFGLPVHTEVLAMSGGTVAAVATRSDGVGNYVRLNHGNGWFTEYWHLSEFAPGLTTGQSVHQGQFIAETGDHLHIELYFDYEKVDWNGRNIDGYTVYSVVDSTNTNYKLNYQGTLLKGGSAQISNTYNHTCADITRSAKEWYALGGSTIRAGDAQPVSSTNSKTCTEETTLQNNSISFGTKTAPCKLNVGPNYLVYVGSSPIELKAGKEVILQPGFSAVQITGSGNFNQPLIISIDPSLR